MKHFQSILTIAAIGLSALSVSATRFAILSDIHVTPGNECESKLHEAVAEINSLDGIDYVIVNGDLTNEGSDEQLANVKSILDKIERPSFLIPGNHENNWSQSATKTFVDLWGDDRFVFTTDSLLVIGMNCGPFMKMGDGHIKQEDLHWLRNTLETRRDDRRVVSFNHYPLADDLDNYTDYASILSDYPTVIHINGHYHVNRPYTCGDIECMMVRSLDKKNGDWGYTLMDVTPDSVLFSQKRLGQAPMRIHQTAAITEHNHALIDSLANPVDLQGLKRIGIERVHADSASVFTRIGFGPSHIYFGNSLGEAKALNRATGTVDWTVKTGAPLFGRISADHGNVAIPATDRRIIMADAATGTIKSEAQSDGPYVADGIVVDGRLYQGGFKKMECRDMASGELVWRFDSIGNYCQAAPTIDSDDLVFGAWDTYLYCLNRTDGSLKWKWNNGKSANMLGPGNVVPVVTPERVIIVAPDRFMTAINRSNGATIWRDNSYKYRESIGSSADRTTAYAKTMDGQLVAVDITQDAPEIKWVVDMGIGYEHAPCLVVEHNGTVYAGSRRGILTAVYPSTQSVKWSARLGASEINGIDIDPVNGDIYVSLIEGTIYRLR